MLQSRAGPLRPLARRNGVAEGAGVEVVPLEELLPDAPVWEITNRSRIPPETSRFDSCTGVSRVAVWFDVSGRPSAAPAGCRSGEDDRSDDDCASAASDECGDEDDRAVDECAEVRGSDDGCEPAEEESVGDDTLSAKPDAGADQGLADPGAVSPLIPVDVPVPDRAATFEAIPGVVADELPRADTAGRAAATLSPFVTGEEMRNDVMSDAAPAAGVRDPGGGVGGAAEPRRGRVPPQLPSASLICRPALCSGAMRLSPGRSSWCAARRAA